MQRPGSRGRHFQVRLEAAIGVNLWRWERQDLLFDHHVRRPLKCPEEEADVADRRLDVGVDRHDVEYHTVA